MNTTTFFASGLSDYKYNLVESFIISANNNYNNVSSKPLKTMNKRNILFWGYTTVDSHYLEVEGTL